MGSRDAAAFVARFTEMWKDPQPDSFADLFDDEGTLFHPTMPAPISRGEVPGYVRRLKTIVPDLSLKVLSWASAGDVVLIEWTLSGTYDGERISVDGADRFTLRGVRAIEGVAYFDTAALWARLDPDAERGHILDAVEATAT
jgi:hypothetical protein